MESAPSRPPQPASASVAPAGGGDCGGSVRRRRGRRRRRTPVFVGHHPRHTWLGRQLGWQCHPAGGNAVPTDAAPAHASADSGDGDGGDGGEGWSRQAG